MQSPIDREICRSRIMEIVPFLCLHCFTDGHSLSLSLSLSVPRVTASLHNTPAPDTALHPLTPQTDPYTPPTPLGAP